MGLTLAPPRGLTVRSGSCRFPPKKCRWGPSKGEAPVGENAVGVRSSRRWGTSASGGRCSSRSWRRSPAKRRGRRADRAGGVPQAVRAAQAEREPDALPGGRHRHGGESAEGILARLDARGAEKAFVFAPMRDAWSGVVQRSPRPPGTTMQEVPGSSRRRRCARASAVRSSRSRANDPLSRFGSTLEGDQVHDVDQAATLLHAPASRSLAKARLTATRPTPTMVPSRSWV